MAAVTAITRLNTRLVCFTPVVTQVRHRRIRGRDPREPHFEKKAILEVCKPIIPRDTTPSWESCYMSKRVSDPEPFVHPYNRIMADRLRKELHDAGLICFLHENPIPREERRKVHNMLFKKGFFLKSYNNQMVRLAITGTKFENALPFTKGKNALLVSENADLATLFKLVKKMPQFILLAGVAHNRFLSRDELEWLSKVPNVHYLLGQTCGLLSSVASTTHRLASHHQATLLNLLTSHTNQRGKDGSQDTQAAPTES